MSLISKRWQLLKNSYNVEFYISGIEFLGPVKEASAEVAQPFDVFDGKTRVEVKVYWFERKPKTTWAHITLNGEWELLRNYSGNVVDNIGQSN